MKKLIYITVVIAIQHLTLSTQHSFAQTANDNKGSGNGLQFNGTSDHINLGDDDAFSFGNTLTFEVWLRTGPADGGGALIEKHIWGSTWPEYSIGMSPTGIITFVVNSGNFDNRRTVSTTNGYNDDEWHHIAAVYDGANISIFIDGVQDGISASNITLWNSSSPLHIGRSPAVGPPSYPPDATGFMGFMDELRMWNIARTQTEIRDNMCTQLQGNEAGLVGYWNMNEGTGNTVGDLTSNNNDGTRQ